MKLEDCEMLYSRGSLSLASRVPSRPAEGRFGLSTLTTRYFSLLLFTSHSYFVVFVFILVLFLFNILLFDLRNIRHATIPLRFSARRHRRKLKKSPPCVPSFNHIDLDAPTDPSGILISHESAGLYLLPRHPSLRPPCSRIFSFRYFAIFTLLSCFLFISHSPSLPLHINLYLVGPNSYFKSCSLSYDGVGIAKWSYKQGPLFSHTQFWYISYSLSPLLSF